MKKLKMQHKPIYTISDAKILPFESLSEGEKAYAFQAESVATTNAIPSERNVRVGCVVVSDKGVFKGANIHRLSFNSTTCAERMAIDNALAGDVDKIKKIIIYSTKSGYEESDPLAPCGPCRGIIKEAANRLEQEDIEIIMIDSGKKIYVSSSINQLLPFANSLPVITPRSF